MNPFDHFVKEVLKVKYYLRYTDDFIMVGQDPDALMALLPQMRSFLKDHLKLDLHPNKIELRKLKQGIDFLGYIVLSKYQLLRKKAKRRMFKNIRENDLSKSRLNSYLGLLSHGEEYEAEQVLRRIYLEDKVNRFY